MVSIARGGYTIYANKDPICAATRPYFNGSYSPWYNRLANSGSVQPYQSLPFYMNPIVGLFNSYNCSRPVPYYHLSMCNLQSSYRELFKVDWTETQGCGCNNSPSKTNGCGCNENSTTEKTSLTSDNIYKSKELFRITWNGSSCSCTSADTTVDMIS